MDVIVAIDSGTTSTRVIAFDLDGHVVHSEQRALPMHYPHPDWVEQDPMDIWSYTNECLQQTVAAVGGSHIRSIGITNQRETSIMWQKSTGTPLGPAINWQCRRTTAQCDALRAHEDVIKSKTGLPMDAYFSASKFQWLYSQAKKSPHAIQDDDIAFGTVDAWLLWNLTEGKSFATDVTNASRTMLFNIHEKRYDDDLCALFKIPKQALPTVLDSASHFGDIGVDGRHIPIHAMIGDQQAALFAQCDREAGVIKNTYGTGCFIMANTGATLVRSKDLITTIAIGLNGAVDYAIEGSVFTGGALIQWLRDALGVLSSADESPALARAVDDNGGVSIIPAFTGLGAPHWKPRAKGMILGLTRHTTKAHIVRAALESIALQCNDIVDIIKHECPGIGFEFLKVDGGASANDWLMQRQANVSDLTVIRPKSIEATALGAARCAAFTDGIDMHTNTNQGHVFHPESDELELKSQWKTALRFI